MTIYQWLTETARKISLPAVYQVHAHYETDYHGLLLCKGT
jgi:hypothetical protein